MIPLTQVITLIQTMIQQILMVMNIVSNRPALIGS